MPDRPHQKDFFVSYNQADRVWAEWIAWQLEEAGFTIVIQAWDFGAGSDFVAEMNQAAIKAARTIAVLSPHYLASEFCAAEWHTAFAADSTGRQRKLIPVRVRECDPEGLLKVRNYIDLVDSAEAAAREVLLAKLKGERAKPTIAPAFPGATPPTRTIAEKPAFPGAFPPVWHIPRAANPHFTGRDALLAEVRQTLLAGQAAALTALHGMGGVGKTQLAAEYAYAQRAEYQAVWWLNAETEATLANDLAALARALDLPEKDAREIPVIVAAVLRWLNGHTDWLLIYDNALNEAAVRAYLPQARSGHILVTSRDPNWRGVAQSLEVKTLDTEAAAKFLLERTGQADAAAARELALELGGLPLALEQAGAYGEATGQPLAAYLRLFRQRWKELMQRSQPADYPATVATTWEISFEAAQRECPAAAALLNLLAFCAPEELPLAVLRDGVEHLPEELAAAVADELAFEDAIAALRRYSLLTREGDNVALHRLVQMAARDRLGDEGQPRWAEAALRVINKMFPFESDDVRTWDVCVRMLPHAQAVTAFADTWQLAPETAGRLYNQIGLYLWGRAQYAEARKALERALNLDETTYGLNHPKVAEVVSNLGVVLQHQGDLVGAHQCVERALRLNEAAFGPNHPNLARSINNLGEVLRNLGNFTEARQCFERALKLFELHLGNDHPNVAAGLNNLGEVLRNLGDLTGARQHFERALHLDEAAFGPNHPNVAIRINNIGLVLYDLGDLETARNCFERALHIWTATLGEKHPHTMIARKNLAALG